MNKKIFLILIPIFLVIIFFISFYFKSEIKYSSDFSLGFKDLGDTSWEIIKITDKNKNEIDFRGSSWFISFSKKQTGLLSLCDRYKFEYVESKDGSINISFLDELKTSCGGNESNFKVLTSFFNKELNFKISQFDDLGENKKILTLNNGEYNLSLIKTAYNQSLDSDFSFGDKSDKKEVVFDLKYICKKVDKESKECNASKYLPLIFKIESQDNIEDKIEEIIFLEENDFKVTKYLKPGVFLIKDFSKMDYLDFKPVLFSLGKDKEESSISLEVLEK